MSSPPYQPTSRRPISDFFRRTADRAVQLCLRAGIRANAVSLSSIVVASLAAVCFWQSGSAPWLLIPAALFCYLRLWLNMLDGMVAIAGRQASSLGELYNDLPDRVSDVLILVGTAHSGLCHPLTGYWAAIMALLTAYVGTLGQAIAGQREFGGIMSKPWRMVTLHLGSWILLADLWWWHVAESWHLTILDLTHLVIVAGCLQTNAVRLVSIVRRLHKR